MQGMDIRIDSMLPGAERAVGAVVIITDVFRASRPPRGPRLGGADKIIVVGDVEEAMALRSAGAGQICMAVRSRRRHASWLRSRQLAIRGFAR